MCRLYDPRRPDACSEDRAEPPARKDVANFCEWFTPARGLRGEQRQEGGAQSALSALFGGDSARPDLDVDDDAHAAVKPGVEDPRTTPAGEQGSTARNKLDDLFD